MAKGTVIVVVVTEVVVELLYLLMWVICVQISGDVSDLCVDQW